jgi:hypothetical protein
MENTQSQPTQKTVKTSEVLAMLQDGKERKEIKAHFGLSHAEMKILFNAPSLKGVKTNRVAKGFTVDDDVETTAPATAVEGTEQATPVFVAETPATEEAPAYQAEEVVAPNTNPFDRSNL